MVIEKNLWKNIGSIIKKIIKFYYNQLKNCKEWEVVFKNLLGCVCLVIQRNKHACIKTYGISRFFEKYSIW